MDWIFLGIIAGSIITSAHPSEEACLGRKAVMEKQHIAGICVKAPSNSVGLTSSSSNVIQLLPNTYFNTEPR